MFLPFNLIFLGGVSFGQSFNERYFNGTSYIFNDIEKITQSNLFSTYGHELGLGYEDDIDDGNGIYQWHYPNDWQVSIKGNQLTLNDYTSTTSQQLAVTYIDSKNNTYSDTIVVHFSDEEWQMTDNYPSQALNSTINEFNNSKSFILSPNPASDKVTLDFRVLEDEIKIEIYDLNGKLISAYNTQNSQYTIDVTTLSNGLYIIKVVIGDKVFNEKLSIIK